MKYIKVFEDWLKEGVTKSEQGFSFDWSQDMPDDVFEMFLQDLDNPFK